MTCICPEKEIKHDLMVRMLTLEHELVEAAKKAIAEAADPFTAVFHFLHEHPENTSLPGFLIQRVLEKAFGGKEHVPQLVAVLASHVSEIVRHANVINIINEHQVAERWGNYIVKKMESVKVEVAREKEKLVLKNIAGLHMVEHGIEAVLERVMVAPPKLECSLKVGIIRAHRVVDIH